MTGWRDLRGGIDWRYLRTGRLLMRPVSWEDLPELRALKADPRVYAVMLGGVRNMMQVADDLADDLALWGELGVGIWSVRDMEHGAFHGITGFMRRPDGLGVALRFALWPESRGRGLAREAAGAALRFAHEQAGLARVVAVAREDNVSSRLVLGAIGMRERGRYMRDGNEMVLFESLQAQPWGGAAR